MNFPPNSGQTSLTTLPRPETWPIPKSWRWWSPSRNPCSSSSRRWLGSSRPLPRCRLKPKADTGDRVRRLPWHLLRRLRWPPSTEALWWLRIWMRQVSSHMNIAIFRLHIWFPPHLRFARRPPRNVVPACPPHTGLPLEIVPLPRARDLPRTVSGGAHRLHGLPWKGRGTDCGAQDCDGRTAFWDQASSHLEGAGKMIRFAYFCDSDS